MRPSTTVPLLDVPRILADDRLLHALTGRQRQQFERLMDVFSPALQAGRRARWLTRQRRRAPGGGRAHTLGSDRERLFFVLLYVRCHPTFELLGTLYGVDRSRTYRWAKELLVVLKQIPGMEPAPATPKIHSLAALQCRVPEIASLLNVPSDWPRRPRERRRHSRSSNSRPANAGNKNEPHNPLLVQATQRLNSLAGKTITQALPCGHVIPIAPAST